VRRANCALNGLLPVSVPPIMDKNGVLRLVKTKLPFSFENATRRSSKSNAAVAEFDGIEYPHDSIQGVRSNVSHMPLGEQTFDRSCSDAGPAR
jgi:hypothetical protein